MAVMRAVAIVQSSPAGDRERANRQAQFRHVAVELFDFEDMSRRMLARHWTDASVQEQDEFVFLFNSILRRSTFAQLLDDMQSREAQVVLRQRQ